MLKSSLKSMLFLGLITTMGCAKDIDAPEKNTGTGDAFPSKPLPDECLPTLDVAFNWNDDPKSFKYEIDVGYQAGGAAESYSLDTPKESFIIQMDRGAHYYFGITRTLDNGSVKRENRDAELPSCEDRADYKLANPAYEEPVEFTVEW